MSLLEKYDYLNQFTTPVKPMERTLVGREKQMQTILSTFERPELCNVILLAEAGTGKAQPVNTLIPTPDSETGYKKLGQLKAGDKIYDASGRQTTILKTFPQGKKQVFKVTFSNGAYTYCNDQHLWTVKFNGSNDKTLTTLSLKDIMSFGITEETNENKYLWSVPQAKPVQRCKQNYYWHPYVIGFLTKLKIMPDDRLIFTDIQRADSLGVFCKKMQLTKVLTDDGYAFKTNTGKWLTTKYFNKPHLTLFDENGYHIPWQYTLGSMRQRRQVLQGIFSANQYNIFVKNLYAVSKDSNIDIVAQLCSSLNISYEREIITEQNIDYIYIEDVNKCNSDNYIDIVDVQDTGRQEEMMCIWVNNARHLYLTSKYNIVTHNTALVQGTMQQDSKRLYLEVDLAKMLSILKTESIADGLKGLFADAEQYVKDNDKELVLFMDEFHQIVQLSAAAVEALKPMLADSGTRRIRIVAATTYDEFRKYISPNQPLVERLTRVNLAQPDEDTTVQILKNMSEKYDVADQFYDDHLFHLIYEYTNRYIPANSQPRKSILVLDAMVGWHRALGRKLDEKLLADVIYNTEGVNVAFSVDATTIKQRLDEKVFAQKAASTAIEQRLQICVAGLNNPTKPMSTMLFTGSTGCGKLLTNDTPVAVDDKNVYFKTHGELKRGDKVFNRLGQSKKIIETFDYKNIQIYSVKLEDGRELKTGGNHLWKIYEQDEIDNYVNNNIKPKGEVLSTKQILQMGGACYIDMNKSVQWRKNEKAKVDPYLLGYYIADGIIDEKLSFKTINKTLLKKLKCEMVDINIDTGVIQFKTNGQHIKTKTIFNDSFDPFDKNMTLPQEYLNTDIESRTALINGLFDAGANISDQITYTTTNEKLAQDIRDLLFSLGVGNTISINKKQYTIHVSANNKYQKTLFADTDKQKQLEELYECVDDGQNKARESKQLEFVKIDEIQTLDKQDAKCIYIDDEEHLYQAGQFVVTHNTEMIKQLATILFEDQRSLLKFDMTEYASNDSLERFRDQLTTKVWQRPYSVILLDEIEKASPNVTRLLLQVLDDGRLTDRNNREVSFINSYIIMTTNAASEIYKTIAQYATDDDGSGKQMKKYDKLIRRSISSTTGDNRFPPELLGRIDVIVPFQPLSNETMKKIVNYKLKQLVEKIKTKYNIITKIDKKVTDYLIYDTLSTDSDAGGARVVVSKLEAELTTQVAKFINKHPNVKKIGVWVEGQTAYENKDKLKSDASIKVAAMV